MEVTVEGILIKLDTFEKIKRFINITGSLDYDIDLISGRYVVDGKSIMGIFSLDLSKPIDVVINDDKYSEKFFNEIAKFII
jgi:phosphotransferase system HPr-like phosphotransfer protein